MRLLLALLLAAPGCSTEQGSAHVIDDRSRKVPDGWIGELPVFAELVWTYRPSEPERELAAGVQPAAVEGRIYALTRRGLETPPSARNVEYSITALDSDGVELWHAPMPKATRPRSPPLIDANGHVWFFSQDADENVGVLGSYAYRISPEGKVVWEVLLQGANEDAYASTLGLRTAAAALDRHGNAYYAIGESAASIGPGGQMRWGRLLHGGRPEYTCEFARPFWSPLVVNGQVVFADTCAVFVFDLDGNETGRFLWQWEGTPIVSAEGWLASAMQPGGGSGLEFRDLDGTVRLQWPQVPQHRDIVLGAERRVFGIRSNGTDRTFDFVAWNDGFELWSHRPLDLISEHVSVSDDGKVLLTMWTLGGMLVLDANSGSVVSNKALGRPGVMAAPVSARRGEWAYLSIRSFGDDEIVLTSVKAPVGPPATGAWSRLHANQRNSRSLDE